MDYLIEPDLTPDGFIDILKRSTLGQRRPVDDLGRAAKMMSGADLYETSFDDWQALATAKDWRPETDYTN